MQYSETIVNEPRGCGVLGRPVEPGDDSGGQRMPRGAPWQTARSVERIMAIRV